MREDAECKIHSAGVFEKSSLLATPTTTWAELRKKLGGPAWSSHRGRRGEEGGEQTVDGWVDVPPCHGLVRGSPDQYPSHPFHGHKLSSAARLAGSSHGERDAWPCQ